MLTRYSFLSKKEIGFIITILIFFSLLNVNFLEIITKSDFFIFSLFGYEKGDFFLKSFVTVLALNGLPLYLINLSILKYDFEKTKAGFMELQKSNLDFIILFVMVQMLIIWLIGHYFLTDSAVYLYIENIAPYLEEISGNKELNFMQLNPIIIWFDVWLVRIVELMVLQMAVVVLTMFLRNKMMALLICMVLHLLLIFDVSNYYPIGISSIKRLLLLDSNFIFAIFKALFILSIYYLIGYLYMIHKVYKSKRL